LTDTVADKSNASAWYRHLTQEMIVLMLTATLFVAFSAILDNFFTSGNVITLLRGVSVLGMLSLGMAITVIGRGVDLSMVATMVVSIVWAMKLHQSGMDFILALMIGAGIAVVLISSYLPEILGLSDRILVARQGQIVEEMSATDATEERIMYAAVH
jgi:ribose/xylose/arabinose/galactoside ABC-type transport system permease subunit